MSDCFCSHYRNSKHPGGGIPVSDMENLYVEGTDGIWSPGHRTYRRLDIDPIESKKEKQEIRKI